MPRIPAPRAQVHSWIHSCLVFFENVIKFRFLYLFRSTRRRRIDLAQNRVERLAPLEITDELLGLRRLSSIAQRLRGIDDRHAIQPGLRPSKPRRQMQQQKKSLRLLLLIALEQQRSTKRYPSPRFLPCADDGCQILLQRLSRRGPNRGVVSLRQQHVSYQFDAGVIR